jgi:hypothetical protein
LGARSLGMERTPSAMGLGVRPLGAPQTPVVGDRTQPVRRGSGGMDGRRGRVGRQGQIWLVPLQHASGDIEAAQATYP